MQRADVRTSGVSGQIREGGKQAVGEDQPDYSDIINLPHHVSARHPQMSRTARAAQFGSFEPLRDYRDVLAEERRLTDERPVLSEEEQKKLNEMVAKLASDTAGRQDRGDPRHPPGCQSGAEIPGAGGRPEGPVQGSSETDRRTARVALLNRRAKPSQ